MTNSRYHNNGPEWRSSMMRGEDLLARNIVDIESLVNTEFIKDLLKENKNDQVALCIGNPSMTKDERLSEVRRMVLEFIRKLDPEQIKKVDGGQKDYGIFKEGVLVRESLRNFLIENFFGVHKVYILENGRSVELRYMGPRGRNIYNSKMPDIETSTQESEQKKEGLSCHKILEELKNKLRVNSVDDIYIRELASTQNGLEVVKECLDHLSERVVGVRSWSKFIDFHLWYKEGKVTTIGAEYISVVLSKNKKMLMTLDIAESEEQTGKGSEEVVEAGFPDLQEPEADPVAPEVQPEEENLQKEPELEVGGGASEKTVPVQPVIVPEIIKPEIELQLGLDFNRPADPKPQEYILEGGMILRSGEVYNSEDFSKILDSIILMNEIADIGNSWRKELLDSRIIPGCKVEQDGPHLGYRVINAEELVLWVNDFIEEKQAGADRDVRY